ncbi:hypothetical protein ACN38_g4293 [Penicillium nordicum]|uniref:Uncharacterized protein n=1 Tax=Penicillium nordicum TaxID=229535 RepID=A0A0N0RZ70_9EURO|nr:hypothetical protein ACN38_g4293 [Penicillium nordicum]
MPDRRAKRSEDIISAHNAIKRWILELGWQNASYVHEPARGPDNGLVGFWATDTQFRATYGSRFHRFQITSTPTSGHRSRRRGPGVPTNLIPFSGFGPTTGSSNGAQFYSVSKKRQSLSTKTERDSHEVAEEICYVVHGYSNNCSF